MNQAYGGHTRCSTLTEVQHTTTPASGLSLVSARLRLSSVETAWTRKDHIPSLAARFIASAKAMLFEWGVGDKMSR
jgi:hypothetical protein